MEFDFSLFQTFQASFAKPGTTTKLDALLGASIVDELAKQNVATPALAAYLGSEGHDISTQAVGVGLRVARKRLGKQAVLV